MGTLLQEHDAETDLAHAVRMLKTCGWQLDEITNAVTKTFRS